MTKPPTATIFIPYHALDDLVLRGTRATQPAATAVVAGTLYCVTDEGNRLERSDGTVWQLQAPAASGISDLSDQQVLGRESGSGPAQPVALGGYLTIVDGVMDVTGAGQTSFIVQDIPAAMRPMGKAGNTYLPNAQPLSALPTGYMRSEEGTGIVSTAPMISASDISGILAPSAIPEHHGTHEPGGADALQVSAASRLLGRSNTVPGPVEELTLGANLSLDGTTLNAATGAQATVVPYRFSTTNTPPPLSGFLRFNAAYPYTAVTKIWVSINSQDGNDIYWGLMLTQPGSRLLIQDTTAHTVFGEFETTADPVDQTSYIEFAVSFVAQGTALTNNETTLLRIGNPVTNRPPIQHHTTHEPGGTDVISALSASILTSGTLPDARLSANVQMKPVVREIPTGVMNGSNVTFTLAYPPVVNSEHVFLNGLLQDSTYGDYSLSGSTVTFSAPPLAGDRVLVTYSRS